MIGTRIYGERVKVKQHVKRIKNQTRDVQLTVAVKTMRELHKND